MLQVYAYRNPLDLPADADKYCFRSLTDQTMDCDQLVKEIVGYNSTLTDADVHAVLTVLDNRVKHFVKLGYRVELPFGYVFNRANGTSRKLRDGFVPGTANHRITAVFKFKEESAEDMVKDAAFNMAGKGFVGFPVIDELCSKKRNGSESEQLTFAPGAMLLIKGKRTSVDVDDPNQGVFLIDADKKETRIDEYNHIGSNIVEAYVPSDLPPGTYEVKLVTKPGSKRYAKSIAEQPIEVTG